MMQRREDILGAAGGKQLKIGREADNDLVFDYPMVSSSHALLTVAGGMATIEDLGSTNGTAINSPENRITRAPLRESDIVFFGSLRVPASRLLQADPTVGDQPQATVAFGGREMIFGRDPSCDQVLNQPMISGRHARIYRVNKQLTVEDLGSANGTFVNGQRITRPLAINPGDVIGFGSYTFTLTDRGNFEQRDFRGNVTIEARNIGITVPGKRLIENVSLTIYPSEFVGLMGPSGAGKTTLMNALNGYTPPTEGAVHFNGRNLYAEYGLFAQSLGYVPQDDIMHKDLTVGQALYYTAKLRLPPDTSDREINDRIARVLGQLGLEGVENVLIGSPERKGISGGQRKRVNLAMELLTDPSVLFLDEPTSGLSSEDALMVMKVLRDLANSGKAILLTIHQPSLEAYRLMDNLVLIGKDQNSPEPGRLVYYGPAYPDAVEFFNPRGVPGLRPGAEPSPDEILRGFAKQPSAHWTQNYQRSAFQQDYVTKRAGKQEGTPEAFSNQDAGKPAGLAQWLTFVRRSITIKLKDTANTAILLAQAPVIAILLVLVFSSNISETVELDDGKIWTQDAVKSWNKIASASRSTIFIMGLAALWFGCTNAVREIVGEWAIYHRERMVNLKLPSYLGAKFTVLGLLSLLQCTILVSIVVWGTGLKGSWFTYLIVTTLLALVGVGIGLTLSAFAKSSEAAIGLVPIVLIPVVILAGMLNPLHEMGALMRVASTAAPLRWGFESLLVTEAGEQREGPPVFKEQSKDDYNRLNEEKEEDDGEDLDDIRRFPDIAHDYFRETERNAVFTGMAVLAVMLSLLITGILLILRSRDVH